MYYSVIKSNISIQQILFAENGIINKISYLITLLCLYNTKSKVRGRVGPEQRITYVIVIVRTLYLPKGGRAIKWASKQL